MRCAISLFIAEISTINPESDAKCGKEEDDMELPTIDLSKIVDATNSFSQNNKIGEGSFGPVYKVTYSFLHLPKLHESILCIVIYTRSF